MKVTVKWKHTKTIDRVTFPDASRIDRTKFGAAIGKSKQYASHLITSGDVPEGKRGTDLIKKIRKVPFRSVSTKRKLPAKRPSEG